MVAQRELTDDETDRIFRALADSTRRDILRRTIDAEQSVSVLAAAYEMSFAAVQKHVAVLETARLIIKRAEGRERLVRADPMVIARARALLDQYEVLWRSRIDRLDALLAQDRPGVGHAQASPESPRAGAADPESSRTQSGDTPITENRATDSRTTENPTTEN